MVAKSAVLKLVLDVVSILVQASGQPFALFGQPGPLIIMVCSIGVLIAMETIILSMAFFATGTNLACLKLTSAARADLS